VPAWRQCPPVGARPGVMPAASAGVGGGRMRPMRRTTRWTERVSRVPPTAVASRGSQQHSGRKPSARRNGWSYTHGGPHAKAPSGDVQSRTGPAAHLARSNRIAPLVSVVLRADHARSAADPATPALTRDAAVCEVRAGREVYRRRRVTEASVTRRLTVDNGGGADFALRPFCLRSRCLPLATPV
jgi:hypothetical protein